MENYGVFMEIEFDWIECDDIKDYEGLYQANSDGEIYSIKRKLYLKPRINNCGYQYVNLYKSGIKKSFLVHRLIAKTLICNSENKPEINHIDGDKTNNKVNNLEWATPKENIRHAYEKGFRGIGEKSSNSKLTEKDVKEIRMLIVDFTIPELAKKYSVHVETIRHIIKNIIWKHI